MKDQNELKLEGTANARQVGGSHYRKNKVLQHWDVVTLFNLDYFAGNITKYVFRWRDKAGIQDLEKAGHYLSKYIEVERARSNGTLTRSILERAILELEEIEQQEEQAAAYRAQARGDDPVADVLSGYKFNVMPLDVACDDYRPMEALGPCSSCGFDRTAHTAQARKVVGHSHSHDKCTHGADDCPVHPNGGCPALPAGGAVAGIPGAQGLPAGPLQAQRQAGPAKAG